MRTKFGCALLATVLLEIGCGRLPDPVHEQRVASLGAEEPGVPAGPRHRPGQPCLVCHDGDRASAFSMAGTISARPDGKEPVQAEIRLRDVEGQTHVARSNCAGNFYVRPGAWTPVFPVWAEVQQGEVTTAMESPIYREGSCAGCHTGEAGRTSAGPVFVSDDPLIEVATSQCDQGDGS